VANSNPAQDSSENFESKNQSSQSEQSRARDLLYGDADLAQSVNQKESGEGAGASCPESKAYLKLVNGAINSFYEPERLSKEQISALRSKYNCSIKSDADAIKYADEAVKTLGDPYTDVIPASEAKEIERAERGEITGIGIEIEATPQKLAPVTGENAPTASENIPVVISRVVESSPAQRAGLIAGDRIVKVDNEVIDTETVSETAKLIRGDIDTNVRLTVKQGEKEREVEIKREVIDVPAVKSEMRDGFLHLSVTTFSQDDVSEEVEAALKANPNANGYILDLRNNPGGFVREALQTGSLFMSSGLMLSTRSRNDVDGEVSFDKTTYQLEADGIKEKTVYEDMPSLQKGLGQNIERHPDIVDKPVVILVNEKSASASELLTGAFKDNNEAYVMGTTTYGKGIGQTVKRSGLPEDSWLKVTTFKYFTPNGTWVGDAASNKIGLTPHQVVPLTEGAKLNSAADNQLKAALDHLKQSTGQKSHRP
jgi:carboxyl-terminal processing protease